MFYPLRPQIVTSGLKNPASLKRLDPPLLRPRLRVTSGLRNPASLKHVNAKLGGDGQSNNPGFETWPH